MADKDKPKKQESAVSVAVTIIDSQRTEEWNALWHRLLLPLPSEAPGKQPKEDDQGQQ